MGPRTVKSTSMDSKTMYTVEGGDIEEEYTDEEEPSADCTEPV